MAAHQAPPSLEFSRQEHWSGLPFPSPMQESEKCKCSRSVLSDSSQPHGVQPIRLLRPWDFPGKSTAVGCHCLLQTYRHNVYLKWNEVILERRITFFLSSNWFKSLIEIHFSVALADWKLILFFFSIVLSKLASWSLEDYKNSVHLPSYLLVKS